MSTPNLHNLSPQEVKGMIDRHEIVLIDVRTPQEYMFEHIEGAMLFPMAGFKPDLVPNDGQKRVVLHCGSGKRSENVAKHCLESCFGEIAHMEGGFGAWKDAGLPYIGTDMSSGAPQRVGG